MPPSLSQRTQQQWLSGQEAERRRDWPAALVHYAKAAALDPKDFRYGLKVGICHLSMEQPVRAQRAIEKVLARHPKQALATQLLSQALAAQNRTAEAVDALGVLPEGTPLDVQLERARLLVAAKRWNEAVVQCLAAVKQDPRCALAYLYMGAAFLEQHQHKNVALSLETAIAVEPDGPFQLKALSILVHELRQTAEWATLAPRTQALFEVLDRSDDTRAAEINPFSLLALPSTPAHQKRVGGLQLAGKLRFIKPLARRETRKPGPLRIGYLSNDFYRHATAHLIADLLELQSREHFEIHLFCHSPEDGSSWQARLRAAADGFHDIRHLSDEQAAALMREHDIDVAIDLKGYTEGNRLQILAYQPAPVQVSFLGYPGTTGVDFIDYIVGDPTVTPLAHAEHFSEHIAQMPHSYQPNDSHRIQAPCPARAEYGLPEDAVVLCSFNQVFKISPEMADLWAEILRQAPQTVLWQLNWDALSSSNLTRELMARGVDPKRLFFSPRIKAEQHITRLQCADLMLDAWPCNAHTTASDALWAGVPVLTVPGATFASRVASSLVQACGLPELSCPDAATYVERAVTLVNHPAELQRLQHHLREQRHSLPLFDTARYARDFDRLLLRMWARHEQGLPPAALPAQASEPLTR